MVDCELIITYAIRLAISVFTLVNLYKYYSKLYTLFSFLAYIIYIYIYIYISECQIIIIEHLLLL